MKVLATVALLCTAFFVSLDAAPVLNPSWLPRALANFGNTVKQESDRDEVAKTLQNVFSSIEANRKVGNIQVNNEIGSLVVDSISKILSAASKRTDPDDVVGNTFLNGASNILSLLGKRFEEGGEIQSDDEIQKAFMKTFGSLLSAAMKKINDAEAQSANEIAPIFLNVAKTLFSGIRKNVNPNDEFSQSVLDGFGNILTAVGRKFTESDGRNGGGVQVHSSAETMRASNFVDLLRTLRGTGIERWIDNNAVTVPAYLPTTESFDQTTTASANKKFATGEAGSVDLDLSKEAKTQLWGALLGGLASSVLNRYLDG